MAESPVGSWLLARLWVSVGCQQRVPALIVSLYIPAAAPESTTMQPRYHTDADEKQNTRGWEIEVLHSWPMLIFSFLPHQNPVPHVHEAGTNLDTMMMVRAYILGHSCTCHLTLATESQQTESAYGAKLHCGGKTSRDFRSFIHYTTCSPLVSRSLWNPHKPSSMVRSVSWLFLALECSSLVAWCSIICDVEDKSSD